MVKLISGNAEGPLHARPPDVEVEVKDMSLVVTTKANPPPSVNALVTYWESGHDKDKRSTGFAKGPHHARPPDGEIESKATLSPAVTDTSEAPLHARPPDSDKDKLTVTVVQPRHNKDELTSANAEDPHAPVLQLYNSLPCGSAKCTASSRSRTSCPWKPTLP